jgi:RNA polymerase sigma-70 factor (ECF subfamily)
MDTKFISEERLIEGCRRGQARAQRQLYEHYAPRMMAVCVRYTGNKDVACDVLQEGFVKVFGRMDSYRGGSFAAWLRKIMVNTALDMLRGQDVLRFSADIEDYTEVFEDSEASVLDRMSERDLLDCIATLPEGYRTVFNLYAIEGYSHAEIGEMLGIAEVSSRTQFFKARNLLKEKIEQF